MVSSRVRQWHRCGKDLGDGCHSIPPPRRPSIGLCWGGGGKQVQAGFRTIALRMEKTLERNDEGTMTSPGRSKNLLPLENQKPNLHLEEEPRVKDTVEATCSRQSHTPCKRLSVSTSAVGPGNLQRGPFVASPCEAEPPAPSVQQFATSE